ncbi:MAG: beta-galactosidase, partial [Candidatus Hydrogenedentota bacterium]
DRFYLTNLKRKYGEDFAEEWRETTYNRFRSWGLNTIANWSQGDVLADSPLPYTANIGVHGRLPRVEGTTGFWSKLAEVFDPNFEAIADERVAAVARDHKDNPLCIGYFVDNEMAWDSVRDGVLASPPEQPSRIVFIKRLQEKYRDLAALNAAWGSDAKDWDSLRVPARPTKKCLADLDELAYMFARRYFDVINAALEKHAPNQLYLGVRFMQTAPRPIMRACADVADVVSVNRYNTTINPEEWEGENALGKPVLVSEFHIGAPDRFMMHPGLVAAETQEERAEMLKQYLYSTIDSPVFVGCHWFQYMDQPVTGRHFDLEPFNTGLVSGTDLPYPEMIDALQDVLSNAYERRAEE